MYMNNVAQMLKKRNKKQTQIQTVPLPSEDPHIDQSGGRRLRIT